jgi:Family of unknown function (DUF6527)
MTRASTVTFVFVDSAPELLQPATLYVSTKYRAIVHLCLCGCGEKVLLNLDPHGWSFTFDGRSISIHDSVGNVGLPCRSHYIVRKNQVTWLPPMRIDPKIALGSEVGQTDQKIAKPRWFTRWFRSRR